ncbi:MAG: two-component system, NarL family, sensor histidine kinase DegS [Clostridiales bacterium]|nr:two-component system, NarL family, sensor histidine kinase DegS [Clostridiales bacterium]MDN5298658.1 two-component system, NarL family, sensor histidine kinase DegS [Clostridiales bacterium]
MDEIIHKTVNSIEDGKKEIFEISEKSRREFSNYTQELHNIKTKLALTINEVDKLEIRSKMARNMIATISSHFDEFTEKDIKEAYELAQKVQVELSLKRKEEKALNERRNELERLLSNTQDVIHKSEALETKVSVALEYLTSSISEQIGDQILRKDVNYRIIEAQENEKKRISRDMHDGPAQYLANIIYKSEYLSKIIETSPSKARKEIAEIQEDIRTTLKDIRRIIYDLMPMSLDDLGLIPTVKRLITDIGDNNDIEIVTFMESKEEILDNMINLMIFRIVQESFTNILKHANAKHVKFSLIINHEMIALEIEDDGIGFDLQSALDSRKGFGLYNLRERVELLNGNFNIITGDRMGTKIIIQIPNNKSGGKHGEG